jgi:hypothetical protein
MRTAFGFGALLAASVLTLCGQSSLPLEPPHETGNSVTGSFEGWFKYPDGTFGFLLGYYNRNRGQEIDIPVGPDNRIEPGGPDRGQPTHFTPGRTWGVFTVKVPADFGEKKLTWTIVANGKTTAIPLSLKPDWEISPFVEASVGNTPPVISFAEKSPGVQGPQVFVTQRSAKVRAPLTVTVWVADDAKFTSNSGAKPKILPPPVIVTWSKYRGPGEVTFSNNKPVVEKTQGSAAFNGQATTTATFSEPGEYVLHVVANDYSGEGGGGFQCCWTTAQVKVSVEP